MNTNRNEDAILILGETFGRWPGRRFGIKQRDRFSHIYVIGQTGVGKTTLLETMIMQDIAAGRGCTVLDPHGDMAERVYHKALNIPEARERMIYLDAPNSEQPYGYNPMRRVSEPLRPLLASGMLEIFKKLWSEAWGVRMEHIFRNVLITLLDQPHSTLADIPRILSDKRFRSEAQRHITSDYVRDFWSLEFAKYSYRYRADSIAPILNKVGGFLANPTLNRILTRPEKNLSLRQIMDEKQVLIVNLAKGKLGEDGAHLIGGLLVTSLGLAAFSRADISEDNRVAHHMYADEFQNFTTLSLINMASELRKFALSLCFTNQYLSQIDPDIRAAILGNFGSLICFRVGASDSRLLINQLGNSLEPADIVHLDNYQCYVRLLIEGEPSIAFSSKSIDTRQLLLENS